MVEVMTCVAMSSRSSARGTPQDRALGLHLADKIPRAGGQESGGDDGVLIVGRDDVPGDLFAQEAIVGLVLVEGLDDVIAIAPGMGAAFVAFETMGVRVVRDVQPMARKALAVMRRGQQAIDEAGVGAGGGIVDEGFNRFDRGRQAVQVEGQAANQGPAISGFGHLQALVPQGGIEEGVDGMAGAEICLQGLPGPVLQALVFAGENVRPIRALVDPAFQGRDF